MQLKLYSSEDRLQEPLYLIKSDIATPTHNGITQIIGASSTKSLLTPRGWGAAVVLWLSNAIDAIQISSMGFLISALQKPLAERPTPTPEWLFPSKDLLLTEGQIAVWSSTVYLMMLLGGLVSTPITNFRGARWAMLSSFFICLVAFLLSAEAPNFITLTLLQATIGFTLGYRIPITYSTMGSNFFTEKSAIFVVSAASFLWCVGSIYASLAGWLALGTIFAMSWRSYMLILAFPSLVLSIIGWFFMYEPVHSGISIQKSLIPALDLLRVNSGKINVSNGITLVEIIGPQLQSSESDYNKTGNHVYSCLLQAVAFDNEAVPTRDDDSHFFLADGDHINNASIYPQWRVDVSNEDQIAILYYYLAKHWSVFPSSLLIESDPLHTNANPSDTTPLLGGPSANYTNHIQEEDDMDPTLENSPSSELVPSLSSLVESPSQSAFGNNSGLNDAQYLQSKWFLIIVLSIVWFIVTFASAGFSSFLPTLWNALIPEEKRTNPDMDYIIAFGYSLVQFPAGILNIALISRFFPPTVLLLGAVIAAISLLALTISYLSSIYLAMAFVFLSQFGTSTLFCAVNYVGLAYFKDEDKVSAYAIQASVGKMGAFIAQYVFAFLVHISPRILLIVVTILTAILLVVCAWFRLWLTNQQLEKSP